MAVDRSSDPNHFQVVILGNGLSAGLIAKRLLESKVSFIILGNGTPFRGAAYQTGHIGLLNTPAKSLSIDESNPLAFCDFAHCEPEDFVLRSKFGDYLSKELDVLLPYCLTGEIMRVERSKDSVSNFCVQFDEGVGSTIIQADLIVVATGNGIPRLPSVLGALPEDISRKIITNPWIIIDKAKFPEPAHFLVIGTGLTMIDIVHQISALRAQGIPSTVTAYSHSGNIPAFHRQHWLDVKHYALELLPTSLYGLFIFLRKEIRASKDWRQVIDKIRPHNRALYSRLTNQEKLTFRKRIAPIWNRYRHRAPQQLEPLIEGAVKESWLTIRSQKDSNLSIALSLNEADYIINATGPDCRVPSFLEELKLPIHSIGEGLSPIDGCKVEDNVFAIGNLLRSAYLETTAIPDIKTQAREIAESIFKVFNSKS
jgi:uncharacterized NAD(P)/FAD-binding protein YdhS